MTLLENRDDYPLTNIRWKSAILWFVALPALAGLSENDPSLAVGGAALGLGFCILISVVTYGSENHADSLPARIVLAAVISALLTLVVALVGFVTAALVSVLTPTVALGALACAVFVGTMFVLS